MQLSGPSMIAGSVDGADAGVLAGVAGVLAGAAGSGVALTGAAALGATAGGAGSTRGAVVASGVNAAGCADDDETVSRGTGVYVSEDISGSKTRRGRFFLRGGLITGGEERQRTQVTK